MLNAKIKDLLIKIQALLSPGIVRYSTKEHEQTRTEVLSEIKVFLEASLEVRPPERPEPTTVPSSGMPRQDDGPKRVSLPIIKE